ncbi:MAG TPA: aminotransferase class I and II [Saprospiraceae bacterium]|nr:aminotransferase class I and II [Saprospiraceae bacterium]HRJ13532.1 aminotransferase class I and II [Saprospiraceae bacterium]HRK81659.1 aminotransferase class I and II [Saprospiraceae bacterium]
MSYHPSELRRVNIIRYVTPLREGGSLPAIVEADDDFLYVAKFRGAGQGTKALIADLIGAEMARVAGLQVPELVLADLDESFGRTEPDEEIQDLLKFSTGTNLGVHYLSGAISYDPVVNKAEPLTASKIVWLDALLTNVDRTARNTNMLVWNRELWMIDFGAGLYFHHSWDNWEQQSQSAFPHIKTHVLLSQAAQLDEADELLRQAITSEIIAAILAAIPDDWLHGHGSPDEMRAVYHDFLTRRIAASSTFLNTAKDARAGII